MKVNNYGLLLTIIIYIIVVFISIAMFGSNISSVILENIGTSSFIKNGVTHYYWEGYVCNIIFLVLLSCHIPVIFFFGKEGLLIIIDELDRKSISNALKLKFNTLEKRLDHENTLQRVTQLSD